MSLFMIGCIIGYLLGLITCYCLIYIYYRCLIRNYKKAWNNASIRVISIEDNSFDSDNKNIYH